MLIYCLTSTSSDLLHHKSIIITILWYIKQPIEEGHVSHERRLNFPVQWHEIKQFEI